MEGKKHIVVFSHGFGVRKDDRGLLTDIATSLGEEVESLLFDYNLINEAENTITVRPFSEQVQILEKVLHDVYLAWPNTIIDIVAHSQGCTVVSLAKPQKIRRTVFLDPSIETSTERLIEMFQSRQGTDIRQDGVSKLARLDGSITLVPSRYWSEREQAKPIELYNLFSAQTKLIVIKAQQSKTLSEENMKNFDSKIEVTSLPGDHNFSGNARVSLCDLIQTYLLK